MVMRVVHPLAEKSHQDVSIQPLVGDSSRGTANGRSIKSGRPSDYLSRGHRQSTLPPPIKWGGLSASSSLAQQLHGRPPLLQKNLTRMFPSSPLLERILEGPLMADPSKLDALPIICQEDIDSPPLPPPIRWGGCKDIWRDDIPSCSKKIISYE
ncbi:hypothetical protein CEXT_425241 [Caerostris extrusa]|uniref:Uncharacterized protein n=1 Tax=Caerostris extrusa TaxID=172846 RepID=A0AAV4T8Z8_CAEEX|nr:hypothetical protein CEXT_425241 [Caerostris extrusa]